MYPIMKMPQKNRLTLEGFRPARKGEPGYSKRWYYNENTGETLPYRQFRKLAQRVPTQQKTVGTSKTKKERKTRIDKGLSRADYKELREFLKQGQKQKRTKKRTKKLTKKVGQERYESAKRHHIDKLNQERERRGYTPFDYNYVPDEPEFYDLYDVIKHPSDYTPDRVDDAYDYFWGDAYDDESDYDYPHGETP